MSAAAQIQTSGSSKCQDDEGNKDTVSVHRWEHSRGGSKAGHRVGELSKEKEQDQKVYN